MGDGGGGDNTPVLVSFNHAMESRIRGSEPGETGEREGRRLPFPQSPPALLYLHALNQIYFHVLLLSKDVRLGNKRLVREAGLIDG